MTFVTHISRTTTKVYVAFLATFRRFIARRGKPIEVNFDNGTNFVGANNQLKQFLQLATNTITENTAQKGICWKFIPAHAPHFGGLWEGGVKATKYHIQRVVGLTILSFEEFTTILAQVEATLHSRPLCEQSNDPQDLQFLTPGHFPSVCAKFS
ncbi:uncharacterized protein LOC126837891 [Adelges cooleyi]|uniref:uncharacterized protein LOC126837891 n=1 Tax=Adelges cooleyi TaxID=133065 RepID=UPI002180264C|nr:uncharacterized protein LOC126837891 [Adelges cooleyi]